MELIKDWNNFTKFWSVRFGVGSAFFSVLQALVSLGDVLYVFDGIIPSGTFAILAGVCALASVIARVIAQKSLDDKQEEGDARKA